MNYSSVEEIFSVGIANMEILRNSSRQDDGVDVITGVDWFSFNGTVASTIYVSGNSFIGFGSSSEHLKVNRRDGAMFSLYREEGTLRNHYRFLKIRWVGYSAYNYTTSAYALAYDVILWDTGDISLRVVAIPTSSNNGTYSLVAASTYNYTVSTSAPDVTFKKTDSGFEVSNTIIELELFEKRYLIRSGSTYYTVVDDALSEIGTIEITSEAFLTHGTQVIPAFSLLAGLPNLEILYWTDKGPSPTEGLVVNGVPPLPQIVHYATQSIPEGSSILKIEANVSKDVLLTITFDEGATWQYYQDNAWTTASSTSDGMTAQILKNIQQDTWAEVATSSTYQMRCALPAITSTAGSIAVGYTD
jgi:hypothetical protein